MDMCSPLAVNDKRIMPPNKIPDNLVTTLPNETNFPLMMRGQAKE